MIIDIYNKMFQTANTALNVQLNVFWDFYFAIIQGDEMQMLGCINCKWNKESKEQNKS